MNNQKKFRRKKKGERNSFPIRQHRFRAEKHPIKLMTEPLKVRITAPLNHQEKQMVEGLSRMFDCDENTAMRIAIHEMCRQGNFYELSIMNEVWKKRRTLPRAKRSTFSISREEKDKLDVAQDQFDGLLLGQVVIYAIRWMTRQLRETRYRPEKCVRKRQATLEREWMAANYDGSDTTLSALRKASWEAKEKAKAECLAKWEAAANAYRDRELTLDNLSREGTLTPYLRSGVEIDAHLIDTLGETEEGGWEDQLKGATRQQKLDLHAERMMLQLDFGYDEAYEAAEELLQQEEDAEMTPEEEAEMEEWLATSLTPPSECKLLTIPTPNIVKDFRRYEDGKDYYYNGEIEDEDT